MDVIRAGILTVSDGCARGEREDVSGRVLEQALSAEGYAIAARAVMSDEPADIQAALAEWCAGKCDLIITTGGTGFSPRDNTPEATRAVIEREAPGLAELVRWHGYRKLDRAVLSRGVAGVRDRTLIINLPGSTGGVRDGLEALLPLLPHAVALIRDEPVDHTPPGAVGREPAEENGGDKNAAAGGSAAVRGLIEPAAPGPSASASGRAVAVDERSGAPVARDVPPSTVTLLETNLDDFSPEFYDVTMDRLFAAGALDVYLTPIHMKKGRPAILLSVLARPEDAGAMAKVLFAETTAFGIRYHTLNRYTLDRAWTSAETPYGPIRIKIGSWQGAETSASPEYEDVKAAALAHNVAPRTVFAAALEAHHTQRTPLTGGRST